MIQNTLFEGYNSVLHTHTHTHTHRLDDPHVKLSAGYNFRFARYHLKDGVQTRTLYKAYGILFRVVTTGRVWPL